MAHIYHYFAREEGGDWWNTALILETSDRIQAVKLIEEKIRLDNPKMKIGTMTVQIKLDHPVDSLLGRVCSRCCDLRMMEDCRAGLYREKYGEGHHINRIQGIVSGKDCRICRDCWEIEKAKDAENQHFSIC